MQKRFKIVLSVSALFLLVAIIVLFGASSNEVEAESITKLSATERLNKARNTLEQLALQPNQNNNALISLSNLNSLGTIKEIATKYNLSVKKLYHAYSTNRNVFKGGYINKDNKSLEQIFIEYPSEIKKGVQDNITTLKQKLVDTGEAVSNVDEKAKEDQKSIEAMKTLLADYESQLADMNMNGLHIYGIQVSGVNANLVKLNEDPNVNLVEIIGELDKKATPIFPTK